MLNMLFKSQYLMYYIIIIVYGCVSGQRMDWSVRAAKYKDSGAYNPYRDLDFCSKTCAFKNKTQIVHVACKCNNVGIKNLGCISYLKRYTVEMRLFLIQRLNMMRNGIVLGVGRDYFPTSSDMRVINYDIGLEFMARCTANRCALQHDLCRITLRHRYVQQVIFLMRSETKVSVRMIVERALSSWLLSRLSYKLEIDNKTNSVVGSWQAWEIVLWNKATHIGCSTKYLAWKKPYKIFFVCNVAGTKNPELTNIVYRIGNACEQCHPKFPCNRELRGLCGKVGTVPIVDVPRFRNDCPNLQPTKYFILFILIYISQ